MEEIWKDIEGYEDLYQVSNLGNVKSLNYKGIRREKILKPYKNRNGYLLVSLCKNSVIKHFTIHRLVADAFIENRNNYGDINHIDECKTNNNVNNLEWCTRKYNINYGSGIKRRSEKHKKAIYCLETDKIYASIKECAKELNLLRNNISDVLNGRYRQAKGYTFRYANQVLYKGGQ